MSFGYDVSLNLYILTFQSSRSRFYLQIEFQIEVFRMLHYPFTKIWSQVTLPRLLKFWNFECREVGRFCARYSYDKDMLIFMFLAGRQGISTTCRNQIGIGRRSGTDPAKLLISFPNAALSEVVILCIFLLFLQ